MNWRLSLSLVCCCSFVILVGSIGPLLHSNTTSAASGLMDCQAIERDVKVGSFLGAGMCQLVFHAQIFRPKLGFSNLTAVHAVLKRLRPDPENETTTAAHFARASKLPRLATVRSFRNQLHFASLGIRHPGLMRVYGLCDEADNPDRWKVVSELLPHKLVDPVNPNRVHPKFLNLNVTQRLRMISHLADLLAFLSVANDSHPGSPYLLCDPKVDNFRLAGDGVTIKFADFDFIVPLNSNSTYEFRYPMPFRGKFFHHYNDTLLEPRIYAGSRCGFVSGAPCNYPCYTEGLKGFREHGSEFQCHTDNLSRRCPGLGLRSTSFWFGTLFLTQFFRVEELATFPTLQILIHRCTHWNETKRPYPAEVARTLRGLLGNPS